MTEIAKRNNFAARIIHSLLAFNSLYLDKRHEGLIAKHSFGSFWFVLPTLPMFLMLPWLINKGMPFWPCARLLHRGQRRSLRADHEAADGGGGGDL